MKKERKKILTVCLCLLAILVFAAMPVQAASKKYRNTWRKLESGIYYCDAKGNRVRGLQKIGKQYYYFDSKGIQRFGWQKIGNAYYYFRPARGKNAYMEKNKTINGIKINRNGKASSNTSSQRKAKLLAQANKTVESITKPLMSKTEKLKICFNYTKNHYRYTNWRRFSAVSGWELTYAEDMIYRGKGDCYAYGAAFACMASCIGYSNVYVISSGGHGWAEINGKVYDPDWALVSKVDTYFAMPYSLSGVQGRPRYASNRVYIAKI